MSVYQIHRVKSEGIDLFTVVITPSAEGKFPTIITRSPYVDAAMDKTDEQVAEEKAAEVIAYTDAGYAVVHQHCRGRGKSGGDCIPYIHEREDGLSLQEWIRKQPLYNGELYLMGGSYGSSVHYVTAPFAPDIKGAVLRVQDTNRYNCNYRNGFYKVALHGGWVTRMYKQKTMPKKPYVPQAYQTLPLINFSKHVFGEDVPALDDILRHPKPDDPFWTTRFGGGEARDAEKHANIPILFVGGFYDIYTGGMFDMWKGLDDNTRAKSAFLVCPYGHSMSPKDQPVEFSEGNISPYAERYTIAWFDAIRKGNEFPVKQGLITYYSLFENVWKTDDFCETDEQKIFPLGDGEVSYTYNPFAPADFRGGLSANFGGAAWQDAPNSRYDIKSFFTPIFEEDTLVRGKMALSLTVRSDCEDTCFYARISLDKPEGAFGLRDDITQISNVTEHYVPGEDITLPLSFDEHCFLIKKGERLRVDISSSAASLYVRHTNQKGLFSLQTTAKVAHNTVILDRSILTVPCEKGNPKHE